jgi:hypothetical protein
MIPFAGSDFWVADLGLEFLHWPKHLLLRKEMRRSRPCDVLESTCSQPATGYSRIVSWIDIESAGILHAHAISMSNGDVTVRGDHLDYILSMPVYEATHTPAPDRTLLDYLADLARDRPNGPALLFKGATPAAAEAFATADLKVILEAINSAMRAQNVLALAEATGLRRDRLYKTFGGDINPRLGRVMELFAGLDHLANFGASRHEIHKSRQIRPQGLSPLPGLHDLWSAGARPAPLDSR